MFSLTPLPGGLATLIYVPVLRQYGWANCDELGPPYRGKNWYGGPNSSQLAQLLGFGYDPPSSYLAIKLSNKDEFKLGHIIERI